MNLLPSLDATLELLFQMSFLVPLIAVGAIVARRLPKMKAMFIALLVMFICLEALFIPYRHLISGFEKLHWNWGGKLLSTACVLAAIPLTGLTFRQTGFRRSEPGSVSAVVVGGILMCLVSWSYYLFIASGNDAPPSAETLVYEAIIPGINEEPLFRALLPLLFDRALPGRTWNVLGADFSIGMIIVTIWFGLGHGIGLVDGQVQASLQAVIATMLTGFVLAWMYLRTRSLIAPILFHNVINVGLESLPWIRLLLR